MTVRSIRIEARNASTWAIGMSQRRTVSTTARLISCSLPPAATSREELLAPADQPVGLLGVGQRAGEVVDDLVGVAGEAVERVDVRPLPRRQQQRREVVGPAVGGVEPPAGLVGRPQRRVGDPGGVELPDAHGLLTGGRRSSGGAAPGGAAGPVPAGRGPRAAAAAGAPVRGSGAPAARAPGGGRGARGGAGPGAEVGGGGRALGSVDLEDLDAAAASAV